MRSLVAELTRRLVAEVRRTRVIAETVELVAVTVAAHVIEVPGSRKTSRVHVPTVLTRSVLRAARRREFTTTL